MVNGDGVFEREFSADQVGTLETDIVFFSLYFLMMAISGHLCCALVKRKYVESHIVERHIETRMFIHHTSL